MSPIRRFALVIFLLGDLTFLGLPYGIFPIPVQGGLLVGGGQEGEEGESEEGLTFGVVQNSAASTQA